MDIKTPKSSKKTEILQMVNASRRYSPFFVLKFNRPINLQQIRVISSNSDFYIGSSKYVSKTDCPEPLKMDVWADVEGAEFQHLCRIEHDEAAISRDIYVPISQKVYPSSPFANRGTDQQNCRERQLRHCDHSFLRKEARGILLSEFPDCNSLEKKKRFSRDQAQ